MIQTQNLPIQKKVTHCRSSEKTIYSIKNTLNYGHLFALLPALFTAMCGLSIIVPLLPVYAERMKASGLWIGLIFSAFSLTRFAAMPFWGSLSDRVGRKPIIATGLLLFSLISPGFMLAKAPLTLVLLRIGQGFCASMVIPIAQAYAGDVSPMKSEGKIMGIFTFAIFSGMGVGPLMGGGLQDHYGLNAGILALSILTFVAFLIILFFLPDSKNSVQIPGKALGYLGLLRNKMFNSLLSLRFIISMCRGAIIAFVPIFAHNNLSLTCIQIGIVISANIITTAVMQVPAGFIVDKVSRKLILLSSGILFVLLLLLLPLVKSYSHLVGLSLISGVSGALMLAAVTAMVVTEGRRHGMGSAMSLFNMSMSLGLACGPLLAGWITDLWSVTTTFHIFGMIGLCSIGLFGIYSCFPDRAEQTDKGAGRK
jgi:MFS family permease